MKTVLALFLILCFGRAHAEEGGATALRPGRVEILISASTTKSIESLFGHASLLIIPEGSSWDEGYVFSFAAITASSGPLNYYFGGLTGKFPFQLDIVPAQKFFYEKLFQEQRSVTRILLPTTEIQRQSLWNHLLDLNRNPKKIGDYYFVHYNCATAALAALKYSGIPLNLDQIVIGRPLQGIRPTLVQTLLRDALVTPYPQQFVPSVAEMIRDIGKKHGKSFAGQIGSQWQESSSSFSPWPDSALATLPTLPTEELLLISQALSPADRARATALENILKTRQRGPTQLIRFVDESPALYTVCEDVVCARNVVGELRKSQPTSVLKKMLQANRFQAARSVTSFKPEINFADSPQARHWQLLNQELQRSLDQK